MHALDFIIAAVFSKLGPYRLWRLAQSIKRRNPALYSNLFEYFLSADWPDKPIGEDFLRKYLGDHKSRLAVRMPLENDMGAPEIDEIPSETTPAERRLLYVLFRFVWCGVGNVFEVGPFLGGTTRAIALGMDANPRRSPSARLVTADKFTDYYDAAALANYLKPLIEKGVLTCVDRHAIGERGRFREIFDRIHRPHPYAQFLQVMDAVLPDLPEQLSGGGPFIDLAPIAPVDAFFIDGCKSWFGTKYMLKQAARAASPGAWFIFQDYGMYTCFWIPACVYLLRDQFRLLLYTDCTYVWALERPFSEADVDAAIPDRAEDVPDDVFRRMFEDLEQEARRREDRRSIVVYPAQYAATCAYRGDKDRARRLLDDLKTKPAALGYEDLLDRVRRAPTYRPVPGGTGWETITLD
jgi:hypothetical protein